MNNHDEAFLEPPTISETIYSCQKCNVNPEIYSVSYPLDRNIYIFIRCDSCNQCVKCTDITTAIYTWNKENEPMPEWMKIMSGNG